MIISTTNWSFIVFVVALFILGRLSSGDNLGIFQEYEVHIINDISSNLEEVIVRCQSADNDLGEHYLNKGDDFNWHFRVNFFRSTLFFCNVKMGENEKIFNVFDVGYISSKCEDTSTCFWAVRDEGIFFSCDNENYRKAYKWA
ncbi:Plant self-incompatibility protein S1 family [Forsythia ovata]|uniref:S-protein homolog n=1 Tax=Forsythia ovata TaxID=205694 RepID=A0ABD1PHY3_9LAMI